MIKFNPGSIQSLVNADKIWSNTWSNGKSNYSILSGDASGVEGCACNLMGDLTRFVGNTSKYRGMLQAYRECGILDFDQFQLELSRVGIQFTMMTFVVSFCDDLETISNMTVHINLKGGRSYSIDVKVLDKDWIIQEIVKTVDFYKGKPHTGVNRY